MIITENQLKAILPKNKNVKELAEALNLVLPKYEINTVNRIAGFIAQCGHESMGFTVLRENLNYSAKALNVIFPKYFIRAGRNANEYHRQPERIANIVYANRMGNGNIASGDGWKFRGRGAIQLTGKNNYTSFAKYINMPIDKAINYVETLQGAIESACWFWHTNNINRFCDSDDIVTMSRRINGGTIGLEDRKHHYEIAKDILKGSVKEYKELNINTSKLLKIGSTGDTVKALQEALGLQVDGVYGRVTATAVRFYQEENGLHVDGIAGPITLKHILG
jgi:putative chitinase